MSETFEFLRPLTSPLFALLVTLALPALLRRKPGIRTLAVWLGGMTVGWFLLYLLMEQVPALERLLTPLNTPLATVWLVAVLPALLLPRNSYYRYFLIIPALLLVGGVVSVFVSYAQIPDNERGFYWFLIRPSLLIASAASALVLLQPMLTMTTFRRCVRGACLLVLLYGGFALRADYLDYKDMAARRTDFSQDIANISETVPVARTDRRLLYLPSAPCRFSADGGYVQGCNVELFQRILQVDFTRASNGDPTELGMLYLALGALLTLLAFSFIVGRMACGWMCPLSTLGDLLSFARAKLGLGYMRPSPPVKRTALISGLSLAGLALLMARAYPSLDQNGMFMGCKLPLYPFCKICPGQQVCPVAAGGPDAYPPVPTTEWAYGFFRYGSLALLAFFLLAFMTTRRLWCIFCPMGMLNGLFNRGGMMQLAKDPVKCNRCGACAEVCPVGIDLVRSQMNDRNVSSYDCLLCLKCVEKCPRDGCLSLEHAGATVTKSRFEEELKQ